MNWKVGLFRLWIVLAVIVIGATMLAWSSRIMSEFSRDGQVVELNVNCKNVSPERYLVIGERLSAHPMPIKPKVDEPKDDKSKADPWAAFTPVEEQPEQPHCQAREIGHPWEILWRALLWATWFPALVLAFGSAMYWALAGFRKAS